MTTLSLAEFHAWLDGFEESVTDAPDSRQWRKIREQMDKVDLESTYPLRADLALAAREWWPFDHYPEVEKGAESIEQFYEHNARRIGQADGIKLTSP